MTCHEPKHGGKLPFSHVHTLCMLAQLCQTCFTAALIAWAAA